MVPGVDGENVLHGALESRTAGGASPRSLMIAVIELRRRDVEGRVVDRRRSSGAVDAAAHAAPLRRGARCSIRMSSPRRRRWIEGGRRRRDVERNAVVPRGDRQRDTCRPCSRRRRWRRCDRRRRCRDRRRRRASATPRRRRRARVTGMPARCELPRRETAALQQRTRLVGVDLDALAALRRRRRPARAPCRSRRSPARRCCNA